MSEQRGTPSPSRQRVLAHLADAISDLPTPGPRVVIDGPDGAGKSYLADELAEVLRSNRGRSVVRISIDGFHNPRAVRYRRGRRSPIGFWLDSYDYARFRSDVLEPFSPGGSRRFRRMSHSLETDEIRHPDPEYADPDAVLLVDGIFMQRPELSPYWDLTVFLDVDVAETARRMAARDGTPADPNDPRMRRYVDGQREYRRLCRPQQSADILVDNNDLEDPVVLRDRPP